MRFSIITPSYNQLAWLELCIASIADQIPPDGSIHVEHIIQDGGTPDLDRFAVNMQARFPNNVNYRLSFYQEPDHGMYDALNKAARRATGVIVGHLNCDEQYLPGTLSSVCQAFTLSRQVDVICGDMIVLDHAFIPKCYRRSSLPLLGSTGIVPLQIPTCALFLHRTLFETGLFYRSDLRAIADSAFVEELLQRQVQWQFIRKPLSVFVVHKTNLSSTVATNEDYRVLFGDTSPDSLLVISKKSLCWLRKLFSGAYFFRKISILVHHPSFPNERQILQTRTVGWRWPRNQIY